MGNETHDEELKKLYEQAERYQTEWAKAYTAYIKLQTKIRKEVLTPVDSKIKTLMEELLNLKRQRREATKLAYSNNSKLQEIKQNRDDLRKKMDNAWIDFHNKNEQKSGADAK